MTSGSVLVFQKNHSANYDYATENSPQKYNTKPQINGDKSRGYVIFLGAGIMP